jgi:hypothetical protein
LGIERAMRNVSSPSLISISAMPDSSSNSIIFFIFRISIQDHSGGVQNRMRTLRGF